MNRIRLITFILVSSTILLGVYHEPILYYIVPIYIVISWLYLRSRSYMAIVSGMLLTIFSSLSLEALSIIYSLTLPIPILVLSLEGGFRDIEHPTHGNPVLGLGPSARYTLITSVYMIFLSLFRYTFILIPIVASIYVVLRSYMVGREVRRLSIEDHDQIYLIRDSMVNHIIRISNSSGIPWIMMPREYIGDGLAIYLEGETKVLKLYPGKSIEIPIRIEGSKIGSYPVTLEVDCIDSLGLSHRTLYVDLNIVVRPKLSLGLWIAGRLLEAYAGRGELESIIHRTTRLVKGRVGLFFGVRPFIQGDEPRHIHFKKSVEHQQLMIKEYEAAGFKPCILLVDTAVSTAEDLDEVMYRAVAILINHIVEERGEIGIILYNSSEVLLSLPPMAPINILNHVFRRVSQVRVEPSSVGYVLDDTDINRLLSSKSQVARFEYMVLRHRLDESVLNRVLKDILASPVEPLRIILLSSNSRFRNLYPLLGHILERHGHEFISKLDAVEELEADVDKLMTLSAIWIRSGL